MKTFTRLLLAALLQLLPVISFAYDFEENGVYYNILSDTTCEVTLGENTYRGDIVIPATANGYAVTGIVGWAFNGNSSLTSIVIPKGVTSIGNQMFQRCYYLKSIDISEGVTSIGDEAFYDCQSLVSVNIPEKVTSIGKHAFQNCMSLRSINIPEGVTNIGYGAFTSCYSLTSINIPEGMTSIEPRVFSGCSSLTSINIPKGVTSIKGGAFAGCRNLTDIKVAEGNSHYMAEDGVLYDKNKTVLIAYPSCKDEYSIPEGVTRIDSSAFASCRYLTSINIPKGVTSIGYNAFFGCALTSLDIPEGVTTIEAQAFFVCRSLKNVNIPEGVTSIGDAAFDICESLAQCICHAIVPPNTGRDVFEGIAEDAILYVPRESIEAYKEAGEWGNRFAQILAIEDMGIEQPVEPENVSIDIAAYQWQFLCFPFDVKCSEIGHENSRTQFVVRYYDGAGRAEHGKGDTAEGGTISNWQLVEQDAVIAAGTGFILQHNAESGSEVFTFMPCGNKFDTRGDIILPLAENYSAVPNDRGWNLTGNPYPYSYDMRHSDFTGAVTVWNGEGYDALSPVDDEVVLQPYQAFFVQRWDKEAITFKAQAPSPVPPRGEAVTNDSDKRTGTRLSSIPFSGTRTLINLAVHALPHGEGRGGGFEGNGVARTRIVLNDLSSRDYELECDAAKFFGGGIDLYTVEGGIAYAINERPLDDGIVSVGLSCAKTSTYTITADRPVTLIDKQLGTTTVLGLPTTYTPSADGTTPAIDGATALSAYTFTAPAGNTASRFELRLGDATCITPTSTATSDSWHTMSGVQLGGKPTKRGIYIRNGRKVAY